MDHARIIKPVVSHALSSLWRRFGGSNDNSTWFPVHPSRITHAQTGPPRWPFNQRGRIAEELAGSRLDGDWDQYVTPIQETNLYHGLRQRFVEGLDWNDTCLHPVSFKPQHPSLSAKYGELSEARFLQTAHRLDLMFLSMVKYGYRAHDGVVANVGRDGKLIRNLGGMHRLVMSLIAGMEAIPVRIHVVHAQCAQSTEFRGPR